MTISSLNKKTPNKKAVNNKCNSIALNPGNSIALNPLLKPSICSRQIS